MPTLHGVVETRRHAAPAELTTEQNFPVGDALSLIGAAYGTQARAETTPVVQSSEAASETVDE